MPKQAKRSTAKLRQICQEYPDEFSAIPACDLRWINLDELLKGKLETKSKSQSKQTLSQLIQVNFKEQVVSSFLAADIPLHKLNHPSLKFLFATMGKVLSSETAIRACIVN